MIRYLHGIIEWQLLFNSSNPSKGGVISLLNFNKGCAGALEKALAKHCLEIDIIPVWLERTTLSSAPSKTGQTHLCALIKTNKLPINSKMPSLGCFSQAKGKLHINLCKQKAIVAKSQLLVGLQCQPGWKPNQVFDYSSTCAACLKPKIASSVIWWQLINREVWLLWSSLCFFLLSLFPCRAARSSWGWCKRSWKTHEVCD